MQICIWKGDWLNIMAEIDVIDTISRPEKITTQ